LNYTRSEVTGPRQGTPYQVGNGVVHGVEAVPDRRPGRVLEGGSPPTVDARRSLHVPRTGHHAARLGGRAEGR